MDKNNIGKSDQSDTQQLFKGLIAAVIGLAVVVVALVCTLLFIAFYDESAPAKTDDSTKSTLQAQANTDVLRSGIVDGKDMETGLVVDEGFEIVRGSCTACHSSAIILQNRFTREVWKEKIVWMQETQGLWDLGENEPIILDYLAKHHAPEPPKGRRLPLKDIEWYELEN